MRKRLIRMTTLALVLTTSILMTGCWNNRTLKTVGISVAIGLDKSDELDKNIEFSIQFAKPSALGTEKKTNEKAFIFGNLSANTMHGAVRPLFTVNLDKEVYIQHVQLIVIGEELAREGVADALDFWERDHEQNINSRVIVAKGMKGSRILQVESDVQKIPVIHILNSLKLKKLTSEAYEISLYDALTKMYTPGEEMILGNIQSTSGADITSLQNMDLRGAAAFKGDKMVGWLDKDDTKCLQMVENKTKGAVFEIPNPYEEGRYILYEIIKSKAKCELKVEDNKPFFHINVTVYGGPGEILGSRTPVNSISIKEMEYATSQEIKKLFEKTLYKAQHELKSDIFGFGHKIYQKNPKYWEAIKDDWDTIYESMSVSVDVKVSTNEFQTGRTYGRSQIK